MRSVEDILRRFRPTAAPGAATPAGVPVDRESERGSELEGVFAALQETVSETHEMLAKARSDADAIRQHARDEAQGIVAAAQSHTDEERAAAAAEAMDGVNLERNEALATAAAEVHRIRNRTESRVDGLVARLLEHMLDADVVSPARKSADSGART